MRTISPIRFERSLFALHGPSHGLGHRLGQAMSQGDRDHYLNALSRAINEANELDAWFAANPDAKLKITTATSPGISNSPYYVKWANFQQYRGDTQALKDRLSTTDPTTWSSLTEAEHAIFGWVSVVDQVYSAFQADPKNLTIGQWNGEVRQPDAPPAPADTAAAAATSGMDTTTMVIIGAGVLGVLALVAIATR